MRNKFIRWIDACSVAGGYMSAFFMVLIVVLITVEIFIRTVFNFSTLIADEYSACFFVAVVILGLSLTFKEGIHTRITRLISRLSGRTALMLDMAVTLGAVLLCTLALFHSTTMVYEAYMLEMTSDFIQPSPVYIPQVALPAGFLVFDLQLITTFLRQILSHRIP
ncbi:TRAP transporter small permease [Desulfonema ishimotonii]|uniref:TRAP transporter small permease n=1 Tax=Desulfonema ishimotonii TaxID=45657 RepID=A0A401FUL7_9BACT|nr:TRAP transporter small permease [Desulfonema ishimotonii]GBC60661.1 TRAP transporter small permease [Desulfonema ishimotonii]